MSEIELTTILPVFNSSAILEETMEKLRTWIFACGYETELLVVNDGSKDATSEILKSFNGKIKNYQIIDLPENRGKGFAVKEGMKRARGECVVFTDADLSYGVDIFGEMYKFMKTRPDIYFLYGSRAHDLSKGYEGYSKMRMLSSLLFSGIVRLLVLPGIYDTQCGIKMFRNEFAKIAAEKLTIGHFAFDIELFIIAREKKLALSDFPVTLNHSEESSVRLVKDAIHMFWDVLKIKLNVTRGKYR